MKRLSSLTDSTSSTKILPILNGSALIFIGVFVFLNPFPHMTSIKEISFYLSVFITLILIFSKAYDFSFRTPLSVFILMYVGWSILSIYWSIDKGNSIHDVYAHLVKHIILYFLLLNYFCSSKRLVILMWIIIASTTIFSIMGITYFYIVLGRPFSERLLTTNVPGTPINTIPIVTLFAALISLLLLLKDDNMRNRLIMLVCFIATSCATLLTYSRGALIALIISLVIMLLIFYWGQKKKLLSLIVVFSVVVGSFVVRGPWFRTRLQLSKLLNDQRINMFYTSLEMIKDRPLSGIGFGMEAYKKNWTHYNMKVPDRWRNSISFRHPHNFILDITVRLGIIGLIFVAAMLLSAFRICIAALYRQKEFMRNYGTCLTAALVGILTAGMFGKIVSGQAAVIFYIILAMITILWRIDQESL